VFARVAPRFQARRLLKGGMAVALIASVATPIVVALASSPAGATNSATYTPATPTLATMTSPAGCSGTACAPWNEYQGDSSFPTYSSQSPGTVLPVYTPGGATTTTPNGVSGANVTVPNLAVVPSAGSTANEVAAYPSGVVGTPGPLDDYCGTGNNEAETGPVSRQPAGTTLPLAPSYFPHIIRNADGTLTGYFDYRPKDADEALMAATSTDNGKDWTYDGEALEQNPGYCPSADVNDDGQGHANVIAITNPNTGTTNTFVYTLARAAGDNQGVGMLVHQFSPTESNPLNGLPADDPVGVDPDAFVTGSSSVTVNASGGTAVSIPVTNTGSAGSPEQLITGSFIDLTQDPVQTSNTQGATQSPADVINCSVTLGTNSLNSCTMNSTSPMTVNPGDLIEQVIAWTTEGADPGEVIPGGPPDNTIQTGGLASIAVDPTQAAGTNILNQTTANLLAANAPNRVYIDGIPVYCAATDSNPTQHLQQCTTGTGNPSYTMAAVFSPITSDPIIPASAYDTAQGDGMTNGLVAPDGIVGVLPNYPGAPAGATTVMYTDKELNYYIAGTTTNSSSTAFSASTTINFFPGSYLADDLPSTINAANPVTVYLGDTTLAGDTPPVDLAVPVTCTGLALGQPTVSSEPTDSLTGCTVPSSIAGFPTYSSTKDKYSSNSYIGAPGATTVSGYTLANTGEGSETTAKHLFKNNEDLSVLRVAWTDDGVNFETSGLANGGVVSDCTNSSGFPTVSGCTSPYTGVNNPSTNVSPSNLNGYATNEGTPGSSNGTDIGSTAGGDVDEMRWVGSAGSVIVNPDGSYGLFLSGAWAADGDSDAFNQIFYSQGTSNGTTVSWSTPQPVISTDYSFSASYNQDNNVAATGGTNQPLGISAYYEGRAYGASVVQNPNGSLTMVFAGYRFPKSIATAGSVLGTGSNQWTVGPNDLTMYRNILVTTLSSSTSPAVSTTTTLSVSPTNPVVGQAVTYTATVSSSTGDGDPTGTVTFSGNSGQLCSPETLSDSSPDTASCSYTYTGATTDSVTASYGGDSNYATSSSSATPVTIGQDSTSTDLAVSPAGSSVVGQQITLTGTVAVTAPGAGTPTGSVTFSGNSGALCSATLNQASPDTASCTYTYSGATTDAISATYGGDTNDAGSSTATATSYTVNPDDTTTSVDFSPSSPVSGQSVTFTATVAANAPGAGTPTGTVTISDGGGTLCSATLDQDAPDTASCSATYPDVTSDSVTASYGGDTNFNSSSAMTTVTVGMASTSTALTVDPSTAVIGQTVTFTATVSANAPGAGTPTGSVTISDAGGNVCSGSLNGDTPDQATCTTVYSVLTTDQLTATYSGDANFSTSNGSGSVTIGQDATSTELAISPAGSSVVGQQITLTGTVAVTAPGSGTPTGSVTFSGNSGALCSATLNQASPDTASCTYTYNGATTDAISATYGGDTNDAGSSTATATSYTVNPDDTTTSVDFSPSSPVSGQSVTFTATVAANAPGTGTPTGSVTISDSGGTLCSATLNEDAPDTASCSATYPDVTSDSVTASYGGDTNFNSSSAMTTVTVGMASTSTALTVDPSTAVIGQTVTFTATVSALLPGTGTPSGTVTFSNADGNTTICQATLNGLNPDVASCTKSFSEPMSVTVKAAYGGDANFSTSSESSSLNVITASTTTTVTSSANPQLSGQPISFTATVSPDAPATATPAPTGSVTFTLSDPAPTKGKGSLPPLACEGGDTVTLSGGSATCALPAGATVAQSPVTVTAAYSGSVDDAGSTSAPFSETVSKDNSTVTISAKANPTVTAAGATFTAEVAAAAPATGQPTGTVAWTITSATGANVKCTSSTSTVNKSTGAATCDVAAKKLFAASGPYTVVAAYSGDGTFAGSSGSFTQNVSKAGSKVAVSVTGPTRSGSTATIRATVTGVPSSAGTPTGTVAFSVTSEQGAAIACSGGNTVDLSSSGAASCTIPSALVSSGSPYTVTVAYSGDGNFDSSTSVAKTIKVT
jgi:hypothetical protein